MTKKIRKNNFEVKKYDGLCGGLCMQIIPSSIENNMNYLNSIVIGETAFSLIERFFLRLRINGHIGEIFILIQKKLK
ncbi:hypothetical protein [Acinetobacter bereziniae]|uniref:hypothetical protein n=1 Tax=Acinetobacter bereziniae TaxID=106648 RepID=UPI003AF45957